MNCIIENCRSDGIELSGDVKYYSCQLIGNKYNNPRISSNGKFIQAFSPLTERDVGIR